MPELADDLTEWSDEPASLLADAVAYETYVWVRDADEADRDAVLRIVDLWADVLDRDDVDPEVRNTLVGVMCLLRAGGQPYGREAMARSSPQVRRLMEEGPRMVSPMNNLSQANEPSPPGTSADDSPPVP